MNKQEIRLKLEEAEAAKSLITVGTESHAYWTGVIAAYTLVLGE